MAVGPPLLALLSSCLSRFLIDEAFRVASERAPGGPGYAVLPVIGSLGRVRCSGRVVSFPIRFPSHPRCCPLLPKRKGASGGVGGGRAAVSHSPAPRGSLGFTEPGCVTAVWPREPSGIQTTPGAGAGLGPGARGCRPRAALGGGAAEPNQSNGERSLSAGPHAARVWGPRGVPRVARGASPSAAAAAVSSAFRAAPPPAAERAAPAGASVAGSRPPRRVAVSSSTSVAPAAGERVVPRLPRRSPSICSRAGLGGGSAPAGRCRAERALPRARACPPSRGRRGAREKRKSCVAVPAPCPRRRGKGRPPGSVGCCPSAAQAPPAPPLVPGSRPPPPVPSLPCRHRRVP